MRPTRTPHPRARPLVPFTAGPPCGRHGHPHCTQSAAACLPPFSPYVLLPAVYPTMRFQLPRLPSWGVPIPGRRFSDTKAFEKAVGAVFAKVAVDGVIDDMALVVGMCELHFRLKKHVPGVTRVPTRDNVRQVLASFDSNRDGVLDETEFHRFAKQVRTRAPWNGGQEVERGGEERGKRYSATQVRGAGERGWRGLGWAARCSVDSWSGPLLGSVLSSHGARGGFCAISLTQVFPHPLPVHWVPAARWCQ